MGDLINVDKIFYNDMIWLSKAMGTSKSGRFFDVIDVKNGKIYATDGKRLHVMDNELKLSDGSYNILSKAKPHIILEKIEAASFPDCEGVIPKEMNKLADSFGDEGEYKKNIFISYCLIEGGVYVDSDFLKDCFFEGAPFALYSPEDKQSLVVKYENKLAMFMARR